MKNHLVLKLIVAAAGVALAAQTSVQAQTFTPIAVNPSSFTYNMVIPSNWLYRLNNQSVTVTIDHGPTLQSDSVSNSLTSYAPLSFPYYYSLESGDCFFEIGLDRASSTASNTYGIPAGGSLLTNTTYNSHIYQMPYWTNWNSNCICIGPYTNGATYTNVTWNPTNANSSQFLPLTDGPYVGQNYWTNVNLVLTNNLGGYFTSNYTALSLLCTSGGPFTNLVTISYADGTTQGPVSFVVPNWFVNATTYTPAGNTSSPSSGPVATYAYSCQCRCNPSENNNSFNLTSTTSGNRLWSVDIALSDSTSYPTNLSFSIAPSYTNKAGYSSTAAIAATVIYAVSGSVNAADKAVIPNTSQLTGPFSPIAVSGFNAGSVVANSPQNTNGLYPLTATMDNGTNLAVGANTWFEKGWDLAAPTNGFPAHGSVITSAISTPTNTITYQMPASYFGPMSILIDTNHQSNNIAIVNTNVAYTAFSLLTAGASIGSGNSMSNYIILQHADGVNESNTFIGHDWFESTVPAAWIGNERCNIGGSTSTTGREVQNLEGGYPKLFDSEFVMVDGTPVTNLIVGYRQAGGAAWTTYVIAVSATTNFIPIVATSVTNTLVQNVYAGQSAVYQVGLLPGTTSGLLQSYQWQVTDGATFTNNLNNGPTGTGSTIFGAATATLTISNVSVTDTNYYTCLVSNTCPSAANSTNAPLTLLVATGANVVRPGDPISDFFGGGYTPGEAYPSPVGLTVNYVIDGTDQQYLNYGASGSDTSFQGPVGIIVQPSMGSTVVNAVRFIVPVNAAVCDPADFSLDGSEDGINWTSIYPDTALNLPNGRNISQTAPVNLTNQFLQEIDFVNTTNYNYYRVTVQNTKGGAADNSLQIGEIQFIGGLGLLPPGIFKQPSPAVADLRAGGGVTWTTVASGPGLITYQWYQVVNGVTSLLAGATSASYSLSNVTTNSTGIGYFCVASNSYGTTNTITVSANVLTNTLSHYANTVLADGPIAFFRLDEATNNPPTSDNDGVIAYDIIGGHNGVYSNTVLQANPPGSYSTNDPAELPAEFGTIIDPNTTANPLPSSLVPQDNMVAGINGINFGTPTNTTTNFSVEAWVYLNTNTVGGACIVAQGPGHAEQFALDMGGTANAFRFYFRVAGSNNYTTLPPSYIVSPNVAPSNQVWYHVAGVLSEGPTNINEYLYLNGLLAATNQVVYTNATTGAGVLNSNYPIVIGARQDSSTTNYDLQLNGAIANVAIYSNALTAAQVANHFNATLVAPGILVQPYPPVQNLQVGGTGPAWSIVAYGPQPIAYQWYELATNGANVTTNLILNATNSSFTLSNAAAGTNGYFCTASNAYGVTNSGSVVASVAAPSSTYINTILGDGPMALFRLDEGPNNQPNDGVIAYDSINSHNGYYSNVILQATPGYSTNDSDDVATQFGAQVNGSNVVQDNVATGINGINFFSPTNTDRSFSVEAWVYLNQLVGSAGIVGKGYGGGGEEFQIDEGGTSNAFRFYFRNAGSNSPTAASPNVAPAVQTWYHIVGVLYESNNVAYEYLYTNGVLGASQTITYTNPPGVLSNDAAPVAIGARQQTSTNNFNYQLNGLIANVAIYNYPLTSNQVLNHYLASGVAPVFEVVPTNLTVLQNQSAPAVFDSSAFGSANLVYQWQFNGNNLANGRLPGSTATASGVNTPVLTISNATTSDNGDQFTVVVTNKFGSINASAQLTVLAGAPSGFSLPSALTVFAGSTLTLPSVWEGTLPINYYWTFNGVPLNNGTRISGATSNVLTISPIVPGDAGSYSVVASNSFGVNSAGPCVLTVLPTLTFNNIGTGWTSNFISTAANPPAYNGGYTGNNTLELTDGALDESMSFFFSNTVYVGSFQAAFTYTDVNGRGYRNDADGACFVVQNDPRGAAALGGGGGSLGYGAPNATNSITNSAALELNLYSGQGAYFATNGIIVTAPLLDLEPVNISTGNPINVTITCVGGVVTASFLDTVTLETASMSTNLNIPAVLGTNIAYVGFTGSDGGTSSTQTIANFQYIPLVDLTAQTSSGNIVLSWPVASSVYQLESNSNLANTNGWVNVTSPVLVTNNQNQVTVPMSAGQTFYRLQLP